jgi:hypothetical protein
MTTFLPLRRLYPALTAVLLAGALAFLIAAPPAEAGRLVVRGAKIKACYKVKGKQRGTIRLVGARQRCRRGERKVVWNVRGRRGAVGARGLQGLQGLSGPAGSVDSSLLSIIDQQSSQIETLTTQVSDLTSQLGGLDTTLTAACGQLDTLTDQSNALSTTVGNLSLNGVLGGLIVVPGLPAVLPAFSC